MFSDHAHGVVTRSEKNAKAPSILLYLYFSQVWFNILTLIFIILCTDFVCSFIKCQILRQFKNIEKFVIFQKSMIS